MHYDSIATDKEGQEEFSIARRPHHFPSYWFTFLYTAGVILASAPRWFLLLGVISLVGHIVCDCVVHITFHLSHSRNAEKQMKRLLSVFTLPFRFGHKVVQGTWMIPTIFHLAVS